MEGEEDFKGLPTIKVGELEWVDPVYTRLSA